MPVTYRVDAHDQLIFVSRDWDLFAAANAAPDAMAEHVLHRSLWEFIGDGTTRELYRTILRRAREGHHVRYTFRCDGPTCRRLLEMHVAPKEDGVVEFCTHTLAEQERERPVLLLSDAIPDTSLRLRVCSWCSRIALGRDWIEAEEAVARLRQSGSNPSPLFSHAICPPCHEKMIEALAEA